MKVTIDGQVYDYDAARAPVSEALAIEDAYKRRYVEWQADLQAGSARAMCVLAWIIWRRDGRDVPYQDIIDGKIDFDLGEMIASIIESAQAEAEAAAGREAEEAAGPNPTPAGSDPAGTATTGTATSASSPSTSTSAHGKPASSKSESSRP